MQPLYDRAISLCKHKGAADRLEALRLFRFVGGELEPSHKDAGWPAYMLSLRTADARKRAGELAQMLRDEFLPPLQEVYKERQTAQLDEHDLQMLNERACALREASLLESEDERAVIRWLEVSWNRLQASKHEAEQDWDSAVKVWSELDQHHPMLPDVESRLRQARLQQVLAQAATLLRQEHGEQAIDLLTKAMNDSGLNRSWQLYLSVADVQAVLGIFDKAFDALDEAQRLWNVQSGSAPDSDHLEDERKLLKNKRAEILREQEVQSAITQVHNEWKGQAAGAKDALRILQNSLSKEIAHDSRRLTELSDQIFSEAENALLKTAREAKSKGSDESNITAVVALVDLRELEAICNISTERRRSTAELEPLEAQLSGVARTIIREAIEFNPTSMSLENALSEADRLVGRLQTFNSVAQVTDAILLDARDGVEKQRSAVASTYERLKRLKKLVADIMNPSSWEAALTTGNFDTLDQGLVQIQQLGLAEMTEVQQLETRLLEWKDIYIYLDREIATIKEKFISQEDFSDVAIRLTRLTERPIERTNKQSWKQLQQKDYKDIYRIQGDRLRIVDIFGNADLIGWEQVKQEAIQRGDEFQPWLEWEKESATLMDRCSDAVKRTESHTVTTTLHKTQADWQAVLDAAQAALASLEAGPQKNGQPIPVRSLKTKKIKVEGELRCDLVRKWIVQANSQIASIDANLNDPSQRMPTNEEFRDTAYRQDWNKLEQLLQRAQRVGAQRDDEQQRIRTYQAILDQARKQSQKKSFLDNIRDKFNLG